MSILRSHNPRFYLIVANLVLLLILSMEIGFYFFVFPEVAITEIELKSDLAISDATVQRMLGFEHARSYYNVDPLELEEQAKSFALVDEIHIQKSFPNRLEVKLVARRPVLVILQEQSDSEISKSVPLLVDDEGIMFQVGLGEYDDMVVLSGLELSSRNPLHTRLPKVLLPLVKALGELKAQNPELYVIISELRATMQLTSVEVDIYLKNVRTYLKTSGEINAHILETALVALEVLKRSGEYSEFLDMRTTGIVYHPVKKETAVQRNPFEEAERNKVSP